MLKTALFDCAINEKCCSVEGGWGIRPLFLSPPRKIWQLKSPHPREFAIQGSWNGPYCPMKENPGIFCWWIRNPENVSFGILDCGIRNTAQGIWNPTDNWISESKFTEKESGIQYLDPDSTSPWARKWNPTPPPRGIFTEMYHFKALPKSIWKMHVCTWLVGGCGCAATFFSSTKSHRLPTPRNELASSETPLPTK